MTDTPMTAEQRANAIATDLLDTHRRYAAGGIERETYKTHARALWARAEDEGVTRRTRELVAHGLWTGRAEEETR